MLGCKKNAKLHSFRNVSTLSNADLLSRLGYQLPQQFSEDDSSVISLDKTHELEHFNVLNDTEINEV